MTIDGVYTQGASGSLLIELQGTTVGTGYDQLSTNGNAANLAGNLTIREINGFSAGIGNSFTYLTTGGFGATDFDGKRIFPVGFALPQFNVPVTQQSIAFGDGVTVFFDNFTGNADWNNANNWSSGLIPVSGLDVDTVTLASSLPTIILSGGTHAINNLTTNSNIDNTGGSLTVSGNLTVPVNFVYTQNNASAFTQFDGVFNDTLSSGVTINNASGVMNLNSTINADAISNDGTLLSIGTINSSIVTNNLNGLMTLDGTTVADIINAGDLVINGGATGDLTNNTDGVVNLNGTVNAAAITNDGTLFNSGTVNSNTVTNNLNGLMTLALNSSTTADISNNGNLIIDGAVTGGVSNDGILSGSGTVTGNVTNGGEFNPGNSPGVFTIDGDLNLLSTSVINIEIAGLVQGIEYDELIVTGNINFAGQLNIIVDNTAGYTGALQDSFDPVTYNSGSGDLVLTTSKGYGYDLTINATKISLLTTLVPGLLVSNTQSEIVTLLGSTQNIAVIESADDVETELVRSEEEDEEGEIGNTLTCS